MTKRSMLYGEACAWVHIMGIYKYRTRFQRALKIVPRWMRG